MSGFVVDASVTLLWCFPDEQTALSLAGARPAQGRGSRGGGPGRGSGKVNPTTIGSEGQANGSGSWFYIENNPVKAGARPSVGKNYPWSSGSLTGRRRRRSLGAAGSKARPQHCGTGDSPGLAVVPRSGTGRASLADRRNRLSHPHAPSPIQWVFMQFGGPPGPFETGTSARATKAVLN